MVCVDELVDDGEEEQEENERGREGGEGAAVFGFAGHGWMGGCVCVLCVCFRVLMFVLILKGRDAWVKIERQEAEKQTCTQRERQKCALLLLLLVLVMQVVCMYVGGMDVSKGLANEAGTNVILFKDSGNQTLKRCLLLLPFLCPHHNVI